MLFDLVTHESSRKRMSSQGLSSLLESRRLGKAPGIPLVNLSRGRDSFTQLRPRASSLSYATSLEESEDESGNLASEVAIPFLAQESKKERHKASTANPFKHEIRQL